MKLNQKQIISLTRNILFFMSGVILATGQYVFGGIICVAAVLLLFLNIEESET